MCQALPEHLNFLKKRMHLFLERGEGREKETERSISVWLPLSRPLLGTWPTTQAHALTGNQIGVPLVCSPCSAFEHHLIPAKSTSRGPPQKHGQRAPACAGAQPHPGLSPLPPLSTWTPLRNRRSASTTTCVQQRPG